MKQHEAQDPSRFRWLALGITLAIMIAIFVFSGQPGEISSDLSNRVTQQVQANRAAAKFTPDWFSANANANLRKWAHVYVYCALGASMGVTVHLFARQRVRSLWVQLLLAAGACTLYAATDELHQYFVPGRAALLGDIAIDAMGYLPCVTLAFVCIALYRMWKKRRGLPNGAHPDRG